jgi:carboxymethylenebutenolidase
LPEAERTGPPAILKVFGDNTLRAKFFAKFFGPATDYENIKHTLGAVLDHLEQRPDMNGKIGTTGYCMGGNISLRAATVFGDRVAASAAFHGGFLATDSADSPHKRVANIKSRVYIAGAIEDPSFTDAAKQQLKDALTNASVRHEIETYDARHGFAVRDNPTYDPKAAERHYTALEMFLGETLRA